MFEECDTCPRNYIYILLNETNLIDSSSFWIYEKVVRIECIVLVNEDELYTF